MSGEAATTAPGTFGARCVVLLLLAFVLPACVTLQPSLEGNVVDAVTGAPVEGAAVRRVVSYSFLFSPGGNAPSEYVYDEEVLTDEHGQYRHPSLVRFMLPGGHAVEDHIAVASGSRYFRESFSLPASTWPPTIALVPHVRDMADCKGHKTCLERNERMARECFLKPSYGEACEVYATAGWSRFFDQTGDFEACNGLGDAEAIRCIDIAIHERPAIADETSCSHVESELPRDFCFLNAFWRTRSSDYCGRITSKPIPHSWYADEEPAVHNALFHILTAERLAMGLLDFRSICLEARGWWK